MVIEPVIYMRYLFILNLPPEAEQLTVTLRIVREQDVSGGQEWTFTSDPEVPMSLSDPREEERSRGDSTLWFYRVCSVLTLIHIII